MAELKNPKHEKFVQNIVRGLSPTEAYISAGYSCNGAHASAARLLKNPQVCARLAELQKAIAPLVEAAIIKLAVTERLQRLVAIQDRWDALREVKRCFAAEDARISSPSAKESTSLHTPGRAAKSYRASPRAGTGKAPRR